MGSSPSGQIQLAKTSKYCRVVDMGIVNNTAFNTYDYFSNLCNDVFSKLEKDNFDVKAKVYSNTISLLVYSDKYGSGKVTLRYSASIVEDDDVIFVSDENTNECDEFYVNSENLIHNIVDWIERCHFN